MIDEIFLGVAEIRSLHLAGSPAKCELYPAIVDSPQKRLMIHAKNAGGI